MSGHKEDAVEVPFDPTVFWGIPAAPLWRGRKGHRVHATLNHIAFEGFVVARMKRFFLLVDDDIKKAAGVAVGDVVHISVAPAAH